MPVGWMTVLKLVPWAEVIKNAPAIADSAKTLFNKAAVRKPAAPPGRGLAAHPAGTAQDQALALLQAQLADTQDALQQLQTQMQASSELIKALAEQNAELVRRVEINRRRTLALIALLALVASVLGWHLARA